METAQEWDGGIAAMIEGGARFLKKHVTTLTFLGARNSVVPKNRDRTHPDTGAHRTHDAQ